MLWKYRTNQNQKISEPVLSSLCIGNNIKLATSAKTLSKLLLSPFQKGANYLRKEFILKETILEQMTVKHCRPILKTWASTVDPDQMFGSAGTWQGDAASDLCLHCFVVTVCFVVELYDNYLYYIAGPGHDRKHKRIFLWNSGRGWLDGWWNEGICQGKGNSQM